MPLLSAPLKPLLGNYLTGSASDHLADPALLQATRLRRRQLSRMTTAFDLPTAKAKLPDTEYAISYKLDGEFACLSAAGISSAMLGGELHVRRADGARARVHDVAHAARAPDSQADVDSLCFAVFNIYELDGDDLSMRYNDAIARAQELFRGGERVFPVTTEFGDLKPGMIAEISCLEIISRTTHGSPIDRMVIEWDEQQGSWQGVRRLPLCSLRSPQFERMREDKTYSRDDAGLQQLTDVVEIPDSTHGQLDALALPVSTIMERAVATKTLKGATMVRKLMMWKTNKQEASRDFPGFVLHLTDYSPNRKAPLNHEICVSDSETQIRELFAAWKKQYYVRGWKEQ